ncbi:MAG: 23S rRNA (guanosine(2251)-2'-O)-methyltransferase RlmB [Anaerolineales bacterium]
MREWIYGRNPVYEALRARRRHFFQLHIARGVKEKGRLQEIVDLCQLKKIRIQHPPRERFAPLGSGHQGVALQVSGYPYRSLGEIFKLAQQRGEPPFILILDALQDPQNLGALLRTAEAVGVHGACLPLRRTATITPAVVSSSSGASEHLIITQTNLAQVIAQLKERGLWVIGLERGPEAKLPNQVRLDGPIALVVGNEGQGMRALVRKSCDVLMQLPMRGRVGSLNAAVAGSVALYLVWETRGFSSPKTIDEEN